MGDILFSITEWLRTTVLLDFAFWLTETSVSLFMVENFWMVPIAQVIHILGIAGGFGAALMMTLRVNDLAGGGSTVAQASARYVPWIWWSLVVIAFSGVLMATAEPIRNMVNALFWIKMILIVLAVVLTLSFVKGVRARAEAIGPTWRASGGDRTTSILIVVLWCLIMACGRWIAYVPV